MKYLYLILFVSVILLGTVQGSWINEENIIVNLKELKPDLEFLRGFWLSNPTERGREGRIVFPAQKQILVDFESTANPLRGAFWSRDFLRLKNVFKFGSSDTTFAELLYKHSKYYIRWSPFSQPVPIKDDSNPIDVFPINDADIIPTIELQYISLATLANDTATGTSTLKSSSSKGSSFDLIDGHNSFQFDYMRGRSDVYFHNVRFLKCHRTYYNNLECNESNEDFVLRHDMYRQKFYQVPEVNNALELECVVRPISDNYILRNVTSTTE